MCVCVCVCVGVCVCIRRSLPLIRPSMISSLSLSLSLSSLFSLHDEPMNQHEGCFITSALHNPNEPTPPLPPLPPPPLPPPTAVHYKTLAVIHDDVKISQFPNYLACSPGILKSGMEVDGGGWRWVEVDGGFHPLLGQSDLQPGVGVTLEIMSVFRSHLWHLHCFLHVFQSGQD